MARGAIITVVCDALPPLKPGDVSDLLGWVDHSLAADGVLLAIVMDDSAGEKAAEGFWAKFRGAFDAADAVECKRAFLALLLVACKSSDDEMMARKATGRVVRDMLAPRDAAQHAEVVRHVGRLEWAAFGALGHAVPCSACAVGEILEPLKVAARKMVRKAEKRARKAAAAAAEGDDDEREREHGRQKKRRRRRDEGGEGNDAAVSVVCRELGTCHM